MGAVLPATPHAGRAELRAKPRSFPAVGFESNGGYFSPAEFPFQTRPPRTKKMDPWGPGARIGDPGEVSRTPLEAFPALSLELLPQSGGAEPMSSTPHPQAALELLALAS